MQEHFHSTKSLRQVQKLFGRILKEVERAYKIVVPLSIRQRRNVHLLKQHDSIIITIHILGKMLDLHPNGCGISLFEPICFQSNLFLSIRVTIVAVVNS